MINEDRRRRALNSENDRKRERGKRKTDKKFNLETHQ